MPATASKDAQNVLKHRGRARRKAGVTRLVVELAGLGVQGGSLLDGAEAGDAEGLTGLGDGLSPAADVLVLALAEGVAGFGHDLAVLVLHQARGREGVQGGPDEHAAVVASVGLLAGAVPDLAAASTDANTTGHFSKEGCAGSVVPGCS